MTKFDSELRFMNAYSHLTAIADLLRQCFKAEFYEDTLPALSSLIQFQLKEINDAYYQLWRGDLK